MYAMLSLDLNEDTTSEERKKFNAYLKRENWTKAPKVTTTWYADFEKDFTMKEVVENAKSDVKQAVKTANISSYDAIVSIGYSIPTSFSG